MDNPTAIALPAYKIATLSRPKSGTWRFCWHNRHPVTGRMQRVRHTININRIRDLAEREKVAAQYLAALNEALRNGYNYFVDTLGISDPLQPEKSVRTPQPEIPIPAATAVTLCDALAQALKIRLLGMKDRTAGSYRSFVRCITDWLTMQQLHQLPAHSFTAAHFQDYLFYKSSLGHGNRNLNDNTNFFKSTFEVMRKKLKIITANPLDDFDYLPETESSLFEPLTEAEIERIVPELYAYNPRFYLYTRFIAHEMIRPYHIAFIKAADIRYDSNTLSIKGRNTKNRKNSRKQLMRSIKEMLIDLNYHTLPGNYYLFGQNITTPRRGTGTGKKRGQNFTYLFEPSPQQEIALSNRAAKLWKKLVIDGLGINKKMYALKHTSSQYYVNENDNADIKFLQQHMEHHSMAQTEIYLQNKVDKRIDETKTNTLKY